MAIKSSITSTINGFITAIITQTKLRSALSTLLDNFYPTVIYYTNSTTTVFKLSSPVLNFTSPFAKKIILQAPKP